MPNIEDQDLYVCAGICRIDPATSCCVGCGRPVAPFQLEADAADQMPRADSDPDEQGS